MRREVVGRESSVRARDGDEETLRPSDDLGSAVVDEREPRILRELRIPEAKLTERSVWVDVQLEGTRETSRHLVARPAEEDCSAPRMTRRESYVRLRDMRRETLECHRDVDGRDNRRKVTISRADGPDLTDADVRGLPRGEVMPTAEELSRGRPSGEPLSHRRRHRRDLDG